MPPRVTKRVQYMIEQSIMHSTSKTYNSAHSHYIQFCNQYQLPYWPKNPQQQELQLLYWHALRLEQVKASTLRSQYHGVKHGAAMSGHPIDDKAMIMLHRQRQSLTTTFGAKNKDVRKPFTVEMAAQSHSHFNFYNYNELVYYTAMVRNIVALMRPSEIYAKNQSVRAHKLERNSVRALYLRNITPHLNAYMPQWKSITTILYLHMQSNQNRHSKSRRGCRMGKSTMAGFTSRSYISNAHGKTNPSKNKPKNEINLR